MKEEIARKLEHLEEYVKYLKDFQKKDIEYLNDNPVELAAIERFFHLSIEVVLDICSMIISYEGFKKPDEYRKSILILAEKGILEKKFGDSFSNIAGFRNILVHDYAEIKVDKVHSHLKNNLEDFNNFAKQIAKYLNNL
ncbi:MAG: DUF86 domain-containing protein [candidate division WOR-3 bacterium]